MTRAEEAAALGAIPIHGFPGYYIRQDGAVFSSRQLAAFRPIKRLKPGKQPQGYLIHGLVLDGRTHTRTLHVLVAEAFLGPRPHGHVVCHKNGDPSDSRVENLRWATQRQNIHDKWAHGTMAVGDRNGRHTHPESIARGTQCHFAKLTDSQALAILVRLRAGEKGKALAKEYGVRTTTVSSINTGRTWKHLWMLAPPDIESVLRRQGWEP